MYKYIEEIIKKYEILSLYLKTPNDKIKEYIQKQSEGYKNIAIWGTGEHTKNLLKLIDEEKINVKCFIDSNSSKWKTEYYDSKIYGSQIINELNIDLVIISSYSHRIDIATTIARDFPNCNYIDLYDRFRYDRSFYYKDDDKDGINNEYRFYLETCFLIKSDLERLKLDTPKNILDKLENIINENESSYRVFIKKEKTASSKYLDEYCEKLHTLNLKSDEKKTNVAFFIQQPNTWSSTESVWEEFKKDGNCNIKIIQIPFFHNFTSDYNPSRKFMINKEISFIPWYLYDIEKDKPDVVIYHSPYDSTRPDMYHVKNIKKLGIKIVYIPYSQELVGGEISKWFFNNDIQKYAWKIYVRSEKYKEMFKKNSDAIGENLVVTGHPKFDSISKLKSFKVSEEIKELIENKTVFLWNPHFYADDGISLSTFNIWKDFLLEAFQKRKDLFLIIRPHPLFFGSLVRINNGNSEVVDDFKQTIETIENVILDERKDYTQSYVLSDALISDTSSLLLSYMPTKKPILHLTYEHGFELNEDGQDIASVCYKGRTKAEIMEFIDIVVNKKDPMLDLRISKMKEHLTYTDGKCGYRIKEDIVGSLNK